MQATPRSQKASSKADIFKRKGRGGGTLLIDRDLKETQLADGQMAPLIKCWLAAEIWLASPFTGERGGGSIPLLTLWRTSEFLHLLCVVVCTHVQAHIFIWNAVQPDLPIYLQPHVNKQGRDVYETRLSPSVPSHCLAKENGTLYNTICWPQAKSFNCC